MPKPIFRKTIIAHFDNDIQLAPINTFSTVGDINGDGRLDVVVCGRNGRLAWMENRGRETPWPIHVIDEPGRMECGGCVVDLNGDGYPDVINGGDWRSDEVLWWENPGPRGGRWTCRIVAKTGHTQFHDTLVGDVTNEGRLSLIFTNQGDGTTIYHVPLPNDPTVSPWPGLEVIAADKREPNPLNPHRSDGTQPEEGLAIGDVDGDGLNEVVCGTHWYKYVNGEWQGHRFTREYLTTKVAIADVDGDGRNEILLAEGDRCIYGWKEAGGRLAWFKPGADVTGLWDEHRIADGLLDPHSLQVGDLCGNGRLDLLVGEIGFADGQTDAYLHHPPRLIVYENDGQGNFTEHLIDEGTGTHDAVLADLDGDGKLDVFGKPLHGPEKWNVHVWFLE